MRLIEHSDFFAEAVVVAVVLDIVAFFLTLTMYDGSDKTSRPWEA